jgi:hypothetical protein
VQVHPAALKFHLVDLALAVVLAAGLERQHRGVPRKLLQGGRHLSNRHASRSPAYSLEPAFTQERARSGGPHCSLCGTFTGPFSEVKGLFTVLMCVPLPDLTIVVLAGRATTVPFMVVLTGPQQTTTDNTTVAVTCETDYLPKA